MARCKSHSESTTVARFPVTRRGRSKWPVLSEFCADNTWRQDSSEVLHGIASLRTMPRGYLQTVGQLRSPFFVIHESVVSQEHRIHAGQHRRAPFKVVRGLSRSCTALQRNV